MPLPVNSFIIWSAYKKFGKVVVNIIINNETKENFRMAHPPFENI
jgi:IS1 family transposase